MEGKGQRVKRRRERGRQLDEHPIFQKPSNNKETKKFRHPLSKATKKKKKNSIILIRLFVLDNKKQIFFGGWEGRKQKSKKNVGRETGEKGREEEGGREIKKKFKGDANGEI